MPVEIVCMCKVESRIAGCGIARLHSSQGLHSRQIRSKENHRKCFPYSPLEFIFVDISKVYHGY